VYIVQSLNPVLKSARRCAFFLLTIAAVACCTPSARAQEFELNDQTFNQWLFSASQGQFDPTSELTLNLEAVDRVCGLSEEQKAKLRIAGQGDYARFGRQVDELRAEFVGKTYNQNEIGNIYQKIQPLGQVYQAGLLGDSSLFSKVLANTLTLEQAANFDRIAEERQRARYSAKVRMFVVTVERTCPLTDKQRTALVELLLAETEPPKRFGQYDWYVIMYHASKVPDQKFETILDEAQMRQFKQTLRQGAAMEHFLRQQKFIDE
jgi:hypothetical protein